MEDSFIITGGKKLIGEVTLSGAKNVALKIMIAALLLDKETVLENVPRINDVLELLDLIKHLGGKAEFVGENKVVIDGTQINQNKVDLLHSSKIRVSFMLFAPLLYRFDTCYVPNPGGCRIGARPIDRIVDGMQALGVEVIYDSETGYYEASMTRKPSGSYTFSKSSHTGTELLILLSVMGKDEVVLKNCALEPEIDELISFLKTAGAHIVRNGTTIHISPVSKLSPTTSFSIGPDRNEAITFASLALATKGDITIANLERKQIEVFVQKVLQAGGGFEEKNGHMSFFYKGPLKHTHIETSPHPGFMTDWQPNWAVLMTQATGESIICERVFENRFSYVDQLKKLGAHIEFTKDPHINPSEFFFFNFDPSKKYNQTIRIMGPQELHGGVLQIADLRAGATLVIAALAASGESVVNNASILERGYENIVGKVKSLGGTIEKV